MKKYMFLLVLFLALLCLHAVTGVQRYAIGLILAFGTWDKVLCVFLFEKQQDIVP
ncbi:MAG: hypothetical protein R2793_00860 [Flavobacteriaceae bacterium]